MKPLLKKPMRFIHNRPVISFIVLLIFLLILIIAGDQLRTPESDEQDSREVAKEVTFFSLQETPRLEMAAVVEDEGVITLSSQVSAIVSRINVSAGENVNRGNTLVNLSDTYLGGSVAGVAADISTRNAQAQNEIAQRQLDINERNFDEAPKTDKDEAKNLRAELKIQEQNALLGEDTAELQETQARISASAYYPASPLTGLIERIHVAPGELVSPGTPLVTMSGSGEITATVLIPRRIAERVNVNAQHYVEIDEDRFEITPRYLSQVSTNDQNYALVFALDESFRNRVSDRGFLTVSIALANASEGITEPLIPIDAVFMTSERSFVFIEENNRAVPREITTGEVLGRYVRILDGLDASNRVIVSRNVEENDIVKVKSQ